MAGYRKALACGEARPHVNSLARKRPVDLLMAAEEFKEAAALLGELLRALPHPDIDPDEIKLKLARCLSTLNKAEKSAAAFGGFVLARLANRSYL